MSANTWHIQARPRLELKLGPGFVLLKLDHDYGGPCYKCFMIVLGKVCFSLQCILQS
jgi:hypothetical protein